MFSVYAVLLINNIAKHSASNVYRSRFPLEQIWGNNNLGNLVLNQHSINKQSKYRSFGSLFPMRPYSIVYGRMVHLYALNLHFLCGMLKIQGL